MWFFPCFTTTEGRDYQQKTPIVFSNGCNSENNANFSIVIVELLYSSLSYIQRICSFIPFLPLPTKTTTSKYANRVTFNRQLRD
ncbi:UNVERIFIED_CONTAM: hypothetical protein NCL1_16281 [Trichonephila clavipes]